MASGVDDGLQKVVANPLVAFFDHTVFLDLYVQPLAEIGGVCLSLNLFGVLAVFGGVNGEVLSPIGALYYDYSKNIKRVEKEET